MNKGFDSKTTPHREHYEKDLFFSDFLKIISYCIINSNNFRRSK